MAIVASRAESAVPAGERHAGESVAGEPSEVLARLPEAPSRTVSNERPHSGEAQYRLLFEHNAQPVIVYERTTLRIVAVSNAAVTSYGYTREEFLAMTVKELVPREDLHLVERLLDTTLRVERPGRLAARPWRHRCKDGTMIDVEVTSDDLTFEGRGCRILFCQDVTERNRATTELVLAREQLRASEERYRLLFDRNPLPMLVYDQQTLMIVAANKALVASYGFSAEELLAMTINDLLPPEDVAALRAFLAANPGGVQPRLSADYEGHTWRHRYKNGQIIDVEVTTANLVLDGRACRIALFQNVTERKRAATQLAEARDQAVEASNMKSAFLANVSHEIRTPMNGVIGMAELLAGMGLTLEQRECADQVVRSGEQMLSIINDILDLSKIETGHLELDVGDFELHEVIKETCSAAGASARAKGLQLELRIGAEVPSRVRGDGRRLAQVLLNLVSNAVKFTAAGAVTIAVGAAQSAEEGTVVRVEVTDTGIGIDTASLERVFEPFTQADVSTTRLYGGTGLGLAIARELVELMGGTISVESEPGRGSTFRFQVQFAPPLTADVPDAAGGTEAAPAALPWSTPPLVLVAEDSQINQIVAARALQRCGCRVRVVGDGREALDALGASAYDAVLMDCQMPNLDGYQATAELRRREHGVRHTPVIAMTAHAMDGDRRRCLDAGMDDYISKPMRHADLADTLRRWIGEQGTGWRQA